MASVIIGEMRDGGGSVKNGGAGVFLTFSSVFNFLVLADDVNATREDIILNTPGLPFVGLSYGLIQAICTGIDAKRKPENPLYWNVTCSFDTGREYQKRSPNEPDSNDPTTWLPVFVIDSFETRDKVLKTDKSPTPKRCVNSAYTPFADPITESATLCSFSFTQFEDPSIDLNVILDRNETVNKLPFARRKARTLKLNVTKAELGYFVSVAAWRIEYRMTYDKDTWDEERLDVGPVQRNQDSCWNNATKRQHRIVGNLNGSGVQVFTDPAVLTFRTRDEIDFNTFVRVG
jgi:hypothetical protein